MFRSPVIWVPYLGCIRKGFKKIYRPRPVYLTNKDDDRLSHNYIRIRRCICLDKDGPTDSVWWLWSRCREALCLSVLKLCWALRAVFFGYERSGLNRDLRPHRRGHFTGTLTGESLWWWRLLYVYGRMLCWKVVAGGSSSLRHIVASQLNKALLEVRWNFHNLCGNFTYTYTYTYTCLVWRIYMPLLTAHSWGNYAPCALCPTMTPPTHRFHPKKDTFSDRSDSVFEHTQ